MNRSLSAFFLALLAFGVAALVGCTPAIGDHCNLSTDCSVQGSRFCDTSQANGYCTTTHCTADRCPEGATCVQFGASLSGCGYDDYAAPSRIGRTMCLKTCASNSDCRQSEGYVCALPQAPALVLDTTPNKVCVLGPGPISSVDADVGEVAVCSSTRLDASPLGASLSSRSGAEGGTLASEGGASDAHAEDASDGSSPGASADSTAGDSGGGDAGEAAVGAPFADAADAADAEDAGSPDTGDSAADAAAGNAGGGEGGEAAADAAGAFAAEAAVDALSTPIDAAADSGALDAPGGS